MAKKVVEGVVSELKSLLVEEKLVFGMARTLKLLRDKRIARVFFSLDCGSDMKDDVVSFCEGVPYETLDKTSEEIGVICRKPFAISVIGVLA